LVVFLVAGIAPASLLATVIVVAFISLILLCFSVKLRNQSINQVCSYFFHVMLLKIIIKKELHLSNQNQPCKLAYHKGID